LRPQPTSRRPVYHRELGGLIDCPIYDGAQLPAGSAIGGPAVIEEATTTVYLPTYASLVSDTDGNYMVSLHPAAAVSPIGAT
jgi:N-methylhydantoinase A